MPVTPPTTEQWNPAAAQSDLLGSADLVRLLNREDALTPAAVAAQAGSLAEAIDMIAERFRVGGRLILIGVGSSGRCGISFAADYTPHFPGDVTRIIALVPRPTPDNADVEDHPELGERDLKAIQPQARDVIIGLSASGRTPYVLGALVYAQSLGLSTLGIACTPLPELRNSCGHTICPTPGPELFVGAAWLKAATAIKLSLDAIGIGLLVRLGKSYDGYLLERHGTTAKQKANANRTLRDLTGLSVEEADAALKASDDELKTAIVATLERISPESARARLQAVGGQVRAALKAPPATSRRQRYPDLLIGVDGGGSKTTSLLARRDTNGELTIIGRGEAGASNMRSVGVERALQALDQVIASAFQNAGLPLGTLGAGCFGLAGAGEPDVVQIVNAWSQRTGACERLHVGIDAELLLGLLPEDEGIGLVCGTGSCAWARLADGRLERCGGWGGVFGDEGSGYVIGIHALNAIGKAADGRGPQTALSDTVLKAMNLTHIDELIPAVYSGPWDRTLISTLAPVIIETAEAGDEIAKRIVDEQLRELVATVGAAAKHFPHRRRTALVMTGGLLLKNARYSGAFCEMLNQRGDIHPIIPAPQPAEGALRLALRL